MTNVIDKINALLAEKLGQQHLRGQVVGLTRTLVVSGATVLQQEHTGEKLMPQSQYDAQVFQVSRGGTTVEAEQVGTVKNYRYSFNFVLVGFGKHRELLRWCRQALEKVPDATITRFTDNTRDIGKAFLFLEALDPKYYAFAIEYNVVSEDSEIDCECLTERNCGQLNP